MTSPTPLQRIVPILRAADAEVAQLLVDASEDAAARITALARNKDIGAQVRRAQYGQVRAELLKTASALYGGTRTVIAEAAQRAGRAAAQYAAAIDRMLFREFGGLPPGLAAAHREQAKHTVDQYLARTANNISLSQQVYRTQLLSQGIVQRQVNLSLLLGESWREMAGRVKESIRPDVRGGVGYAAKRLARTEINNAFHTTTINVHRDSPWVDTFQWHLSGSHPTVDICNEYAEKSHYRGGEPGHYKKESVPAKPHPQCLCYTTAETVGDEDFINGFLRGDFDDYLDKKLGTGAAAKAGERAGRTPSFD